MRTLAWLIAALSLAFGPSLLQAASTFPTCSTLGLGAGCEGANTIGSILWDHGVNVRYFGAKGDGVTDDTAAIQAAIDYAYNNNLKTVFCPSGRYVVSGGGHAKIYLDPPSNLRSNWTAPTLFQFSLAFVGQDEGIGSSPLTRQGGCQLEPADSNGVALIVGPGQNMKVSGISVTGGASCYRANCPTSGVGIGIAGGSGGAHHTIIENTWVDGYYVAYATDANGACCLSDSNNFLHVSSSATTYIGILLQSTQTYINRIEEPTLSSGIGIKGTFSHSAIVTGGNISAGSSQSRSFAISGTAGTNPTYTTVLSPCGDTYVPNVYNAWTIASSNWGVIPLQFSSWNAGTCTITLNVDPDWLTSLSDNLNITAALDGEIKAATKIYAAERVYVFWGDGITAENQHIENPVTCTTLFFANQVWNGLNSNKIVSPFFNYDPSLAAFAPSQSPSDAQLAEYYCQKAFPFIEQTAHDGSRLDIDGGTYGFSNLFNPPSPVLIRAGGRGRFLSARALNDIGPVNLQINADGDFGELPTGNNTNNLETQANGLGEWDENYFLPAQFSRVLHSANAIVNLFHQGGFAVPQYGWRPAPGIQPEMRPDIFTTVSGTLTSSTALSTYPPIDCQTLYRVGLAWNTGLSGGPANPATGNMFAHSNSCPGYSWGQDLSDATVVASHGTFTGAWSNGGGGAGTQLVVTGLSGSLGVNDEITGAGFPAGHTYISACPGGGCNANGTYTVTQSANISSEAMKSYPATLTWHYTNQSVMLYLDSSTIQWMFPGLSFKIVGAPAATHPYVVTGVYADLGYVTAMDVNDSGGSANYLQGTGYPTVNSCASQCVLSQAAYSWTKY